MKLLTVIVPAYNVEKTLDQTLKSLLIEEILDKTEIIIVDDGSNDSTVEIAKKYVNRYPNSFRLISKQNGGHGSTINVGIKSAQGTYFKVIDGDDRFDRNGFIHLVNNLEKASVDLLLAPYARVDVADESNRVIKNFKKVKSDQIYSFEELPMDSNIYFGIHSITIRTSILKEHDIQLQEKTFYVDVEYALLPIPYINSILFMQNIVYLYYVGNTGQSINAANFVKHYDDHDRVTKRMVQYVGKCNLDHAKYLYMKSVLHKLCFTNYMLSAFFDDNIKQGKIRAKEFDSWLKENNLQIYNDLNRSLSIRILRSTDFRILLRNKWIKKIVKNLFAHAKRIFKSIGKFTY